MRKCIREELQFSLFAASLVAVCIDVIAFIEPYSFIIGMTVE